MGFSGILIAIIGRTGNNSIKVVLATGIFYPDVGGPAIHVRKIAEALVAAGYRPAVVTYGENLAPDQFLFPIRRVSRRWPKILRWLIYFFYVLREGWGSRVIYAFDVSAAGLPALISAKLLGKKFVIRVGGDPIWERVVEQGKRFISLDDYYQQGLQNIDRPRLYRWIIYLVHHSDAIVLYSQMFKNFYTRYFKADPKRITIIPNPVFVRGQSASLLAADPLILFAGRFVSYKNLPLVIRGFERVRSNFNRGRLVLIGHGPDRQSLEAQIAQSPAKEYITIRESVSQEELFKLINEAAVAIGPALSEFNPNFILESLSFGKPVLLSRGHGLSVVLPPELEFDPKSEDEFVEKLSWLLVPEHYAKTIETITSLPRIQTWEDVTAAHLRLLENLTN